MNVELLSILRCPETRQSLTIAEPALLVRLNARVRAGSSRTTSGKPVSELLEGGLVRADGSALYPVRKRVPVLLVDEAIALV